MRIRDFMWCMWFNAILGEENTSWPNLLYQLLKIDFTRFTCFTVQLIWGCFLGNFLKTWGGFQPAGWKKVPAGRKCCLEKRCWLDPIPFPTGRDRLVPETAKKPKFSWAGFFSANNCWKKNPSKKTFFWPYFWPLFHFFFVQSGWETEYPLDL